MDCKVYIIWIARYISYVNFSLYLTTVIAIYVNIILFVCVHFIFGQRFVRISEMLCVGSYRPIAIGRRPSCPRDGARGFFGTLAIFQMQLS